MLVLLMEKKTDQYGKEHNSNLPVEEYASLKHKEPHPHIVLRDNCRI
jgi:hypothetical protein